MCQRLCHPVDPWQFVFVFSQFCLDKPSSSFYKAFLEFDPMCEYGLLKDMSSLTGPVSAL